MRTFRLSSASAEAIGAAVTQAKAMHPPKMLCEAQLAILACAAAPNDAAANAQALRAAGLLVAYAESE